MSDDFRDVFSHFIIGDSLKITNSQFVDISASSNLFVEVINKTSYDEYVKVDSGVLGYKKFFGKCKKQGILT